jgi:hypothetical protein
MAWRVTGRPLSKDDLARLMDPMGRDLETFPDQKYDTQTFPAAGGVNRLVYFGALPNDPTLSNMDSQGQFTSPQFFQVYGIAKDYRRAGPSNIVLPASGTNQTGLLNDIDLIEKVQGATLTLIISNKNYGPWQLASAHPMGGAVGTIAIAGEGGAGTSRGQQYGHGGPIDGGWWLNGEIVIPPNTGFQLIVNLRAGQAITADTQMTLTLVGRIYRRPL